MRLRCNTLTAMQVAFYQSESEQPHPGRARAIIKAHPEVRELMVRNPWTALIAVSILVMQTAIAFGMGQLGFGYWWVSLLIAFCIGAFGNHANYVIIHDATHNLIFRSPSWNKMVAIIADLPNLTAGAMGFRLYHLKHHSHQGDFEWDADLANHWEARPVGNKWYRKALWLMFFPFFQLTRPPRIKAITMCDRWFLVNLACAAAYDVAVVFFCGWAGHFFFCFLFFFFFFFLHWPATRWGALDPGTLHKRPRTGDVQLLWPDQSAVSEHGLPQRAPRSAVDPLEQSAESARARAGILRYPEISFIMESVTFSIYFRQALQFVLAHRAH